MTTKIEKLTDEERSALESGMCRGSHTALRIIDAQAAVIERVRDIASMSWEHSSRGPGPLLREALAAAPEHTAPELPSTLFAELSEMREYEEENGTLVLDGATIVRLRERLAAANARMAKLARRLDEALAEIRERAGEANAANARVAELEGQYETSHRSRLHAEECLRAANARIAELETACREYRGLLKAAENAERAANARADEAERKLETEHAAAMTAEADMRHAESERDAANARADAAAREAAEWKAAFMRCDEKRRAHQATVRAHERHGACAESEAAALRAEVELQRAAGLEHMRSLSTATELLRQVQASSRGRRWVKRIDAFLSTAPALTEHEAAERKVLEAMAAVPEETLRRSAENATHAPEHSRAPALAELARRAVKP